MAKKASKSENVAASEDLENQLKRALADYANLQRRAEEEKKTVTRFANAVLIAKLLDVLDGLEEALKTDHSEGLALVARKFKDILANEGVEEISAEGRFDPELHEGIALVDGEEDGRIEGVLQKGYTLTGKVLRPARVRVTQRKVENG